MPIPITFFIKNYISRGQKFENIDGYKSVVKNGGDFFQPMLNESLDLSSMFQYFYPFNIHIFTFTKEIQPYKSNADHHNLSCDAFHVAHVSILDVETRRLHGLEGRLYLPTLLIGFNRSLRTVEAYENMKFRDSGRIFDLALGQINIFFLVEKEFVEEFLLTDSKVIEELIC